MQSASSTAGSDAGYKFITTHHMPGIGRNVAFRFIGCEAVLVFQVDVAGALGATCNTPPTRTRTLNGHVVFTGVEQGIGVNRVTSVCAQA